MPFYDGFFGDLRKFDPELYRAKNEKERYEECWISPEGKWYNVQLGLHQSFAFRIFFLNHPPNPEDEIKFLEQEDKAIKYLIDKGWIMIQRDCGYGITFRGYQNMTEKQYRVLLRHFKNRRLFRGWTIRGLWLLKDETKQQAKEDF